MFINFMVKVVQIVSPVERCLCIEHVHYGLGYGPSQVVLGQHHHSGGVRAILVWIYQSTGEHILSSVTIRKNLYIHLIVQNCMMAKQNNYCNKHNS